MHPEEFEEIVSGFDSQTYGKAGERTKKQKRATKRLRELAEAMVIGARKAGRPVAPLSERLAWARLLDSGEESSDLLDASVLACNCSP